MSTDRTAAEPEKVLRCAEHIRSLAANIRAAGDVDLVRLTDDGVGPDPLKLSDELWLIAVTLDGSIEPLRRPDDAPEGSDV